MATEELDIQNFKWRSGWDSSPYKIVNKYDPKMYDERTNALGLYDSIHFWSSLSKDPLRNDVIILRNGEQITYMDLLIDIKVLLQLEISEWKQLLKDLAKSDHSGYTSGFSADSFDIDNYLHNPDGTLYKSPTSISFYGKIEWLRNSTIPELLAERELKLIEIQNEINKVKELSCLI